MEDHFPQFLIVRKMAITNKTLSYYQHVYSKFDQKKFLADFNSINFSYLNDNQSDVNITFNRVFASFDEIVKKHAPLKKFTKNELELRNKPWINNRIRKIMCFRDKLLKELRKKADTSTKHIYKQSRNRVVTELKESKTAFCRFSYKNVVQTDTCIRR